jgi:hypothetical protein
MPTYDAPHGKLLEYALDALAADVDLESDGNGRPARNIFVITAGTGIIQVVCGDGSVASLTGLVDGTYIEPSPSWFSTIVNNANTDTTLVRVGW